jgi:23S rRNA-/tRNA-specific pseudouridylate synthase
MLRIVWQEGALVAVSKQAGVASQGGDGLAGNNLVDLARAHFEREHVGVLHRLDRNVSGLVLLALDRPTAQVMSAQLRDQEIGRRYLAVVRGKPAQDTFELDAWLAKDEKRGWSVGLVGNAAEVFP